MRRAYIALLLIAVSAGPSLSSAEPSAPRIDTAAVEASWPKQRVRELEVGKYPVRWRERATKREGISAGVHFVAPRDRATVWAHATKFDEIGGMTPGVTAVRWRERAPGWQVIELDMKVLWKTLTLTFEVEDVAPEVLRFRLVSRALGEYRGVCRFQESTDRLSGAPQTEVELSTWLMPARPVPVRLLLAVERMTLLSGVKTFLTEMELPQGAQEADR